MSDGELLSAARFAHDQHFNLGHACLWAGDYEAAGRAFEAAREAMPGAEAAAQNLRCLAVLRSTGKGDGDGVAEAWRGLRLPAYLGAVEHLALFLPAMVATMARLRRLGAVRQAEGIRHLLMAWTDAHPAVAAIVAQALFSLGWMAEAGAMCHKALENAPERPDVCFLLGQVHALEGRPARSLEWLRRSRAAFPDISLLGMMIMLLVLGDPASALREYEDAAAAVRDAPRSRSFLALVHHALGQWAQAEACHREAMAGSEGTGGMILSHYGLTLLGMGRTAEALPLLRRGAALEQGYFILGNLRLGLARSGLEGEAAAAERELERDWPWALPFLRQLHRALGFGA